MRIYTIYLLSLCIIFKISILHSGNEISPFYNAYNLTTATNILKQVGWNISIEKDILQIIMHHSYDPHLIGFYRKLGCAYNGCNNTTKITPLMLLASNAASMETIIVLQKLDQLLDGLSPEEIYAYTQMRETVHDKNVFDMLNENIPSQQTCMLYKQLLKKCGALIQST